MSGYKITPFKALLVLLALIASHPPKPWDRCRDWSWQQGWGSCSAMLPAQCTPSSMHSHWLWVVMKGPGCLFLHTWEWGGDVGCGPKLISPRKAGSAGLFALCLGGRKSHCTFHNGGKKMYLPFSHSNFHYSSLGE